MPSVTDPQALNRYSYDRNNPILYTDPSGHFFKKAFKKAKKAFKSVEKFTFENRKYLTGGQSIYVDWALTNKTIGPYVRIAGAAAATYWGGPYGAAGFAAYTTRLDGGSAGGALKAGGIAYLSADVGGAVGGAFGGAFVGAAAGGAASGAISSTLSGGDPGQGALYGAASAAAFYTAVSIGQATYEYYASKDVVATQQVTVAQSEVNSSGGENNLLVFSGHSPAATPAESILVRGYQAARYFWSQLKFLGPNPGLAHGNGRIGGIIYRQTGTNVHLDYHPLSGSGGEPRVHLNFQASKGSPNYHIRLDPRSIGDTYGKGK